MPLPVAVKTAVAVGLSAVAFLGCGDSEKGRYGENLHMQPIELADSNEEERLSEESLGSRYPYKYSSQDIEVHASCVRLLGEKERKTLRKSLVAIEDSGAVTVLDKAHFPYRHPACKDKKVTPTDIFTKDKFDVEEHQIAGHYAKRRFTQQSGGVAESDVYRKQIEYEINLGCREYKPYLEISTGLELFQLSIDTYRGDYTQYNYYGYDAETRRLLKDLRPICADMQVTEEDREIISPVAARL